MPRHLGRECNPPCHIGCDTCKSKQPGIPACVDCVFVRRHHESEFTCAHESCRTFDAVEGYSEMKARLARRGGPCSLEGKLFVKRDYIPERLAGWCLLGCVALTILWSFLKATGW